MRARYYLIEGVNEKFENLRDAKYHFHFYTEKEKEAKVGGSILGMSSSGEIITVTRINGVKKGRMIFGETKSTVIKK